MAVPRRAIDEAWIQTVRERIEVISIVDKLQLHFHDPERQPMTRQQVNLGLELVHLRLPKLQPIQQTNNLTDNSITIQVLKFGNHYDPGQVATARLSAPVVELPGGRREEI